MSNIIPFESGNLPAYIKAANVDELNQDLTSHASGGFPIMSIKGKIFTLVRDGERKVLPNPKDPESPATSIDVVIVKANKGTSKVYYAKGYSEGGDAAKPDCFSNQGDRPDASSKAPQAKSCAVCPHNQWGSKIGENGGKGKACQDSVRIAIASPAQINDPMLLRVPPASIRSLGELGQSCAKRGVSYNAVITKIAFELESPTPKLTFKPVGFLPEEAFAQVQLVANSDAVKNILGGGFVSEALADETPEAEKVVAQAQATSKAAVSKDKQVTDDEVKTAVAAAEKPAPKKVAAEVDISGLNLDDLSFDD